MTTKIELLNMAQQLAQHAAARQSVVAENIANVDTPGYRQQDIPSFADSYNEFSGEGSMRATRPGHFGHSSQETAAKARIVESGVVAPNGNSVSLEDEILKSAEIQQQHDMAISIYRSGLGVIRASIGR
ncbi:FlgB family protein [Aliiruegeria sabulilitoris]|uniref:FlgB family protein n=1 Tax=Aliiruegeria sabulilitoris TaxID=1510458 RepID=UPI00082DA037|nr:FlgB family protein [Aliiruegeria sabulilitoris]NDR58536.1 FlgB family protein [Pseudoruegeria sp. M32A2M]